jgi:uncharacterized lipoprotein YbaY
MIKLTIRGSIQLPSPHRFSGAVAVVGLEDVTMADAPSRRIAETVIEPISGSCDRIPFSIMVEGDFPASKSYVLAAQIRHSHNEGLRPGDFLTTVAVPWTVGKTDENVVPVRRI